ncbi:hypothetical protein [Microbacterium sp. 13-71-7]|uniref:hypothetical protein n=1 Tax=Microbacterium sp. 13-71-7 TaxID=1970399 RepID=UPI000BD8C5D0|nr:hypothetical protein [Microbacterium sp. 13-71-7]OZB80153.1 MAG: hypothetical protein B7X32_19875 [Microbacterium sp. 13-71-7]
MIQSPTAPARRRRLKPWLIAVVAVAAALTIPVAAVNVILVGVRNSLYTTNVTISLSYVSDSGRTYSCAYDYSTPNSAPMPDAVATQMNQRDWSHTGQLMYEWSKAHRAAAGSTWGLAMDEFVKFPAWRVDSSSGAGYELWSKAQPGSNCEDGLP